MIDIALGRQAFDLVHAGLIFEYVEWPVLLPAYSRSTQARRCSQRHPPGALRLEPGGYTDNVHQPAEAGVAVSLRGTRRHSLTRRVARDSTCTPGTLRHCLRENRSTVSVS